MDNSGVNELNDLAEKSLRRIEQRKAEKCAVLPIGRGIRALIKGEPDGAA